MNFRGSSAYLLLRRNFFPASQTRTMTALTFVPVASTSTSQFAPRLGTLSFKRRDGSSIPDIPTPGLITKTSRGVVPHLSRDHIELTTPIQWTQVHFETLYVFLLLS